MMQGKYRIAFATLAIFVSIVGIAASIRGLLFDQDSAVRYGVAAVFAGVATFVLLLNPAPGFDGDEHVDSRK
ncbi:MAG: DUF2964 family protein [Burkholderiales bacterium]|nr:DUF2964 family protein [Burkholderiales bacterium]